LPRFTIAVFGRRFLLNKGGGRKNGIPAGEWGGRCGAPPQVGWDCVEFAGNQAVKDRKPDGKQKTKAHQTTPVFTDYVLPIDFEDALVVAIANVILKPKRKWGRHDAPRRK